jgi:hypothetical protein
MRGEETVEDTQRPPQLAASPTTRARRTTPLQPAPVWDSGWGEAHRERLSLDQHEPGGGALLGISSRVRSLRRYESCAD